MAPSANDIPQREPSIGPRTPASGGSSGSDEPTRVTDGGSSAASPEAVEAGPLGPSIEGYALKEEIHRGGQGIVYRAIQLGTKREVGLKVLLEGRFAGATARRRFEREIELAASLRHPNIVTILDSGLSRGRYYFAMEYIDGIRLDRYLAQKRPSLQEALLLFEKTCEAVNYAHQRGVIHRDLKPPNILVDPGGQPHILDFGLAKPVHRIAPSESTVQVLSTSGQLLGTVAYMSPEQAAGSQDVDVRTDVYSLGVIFYEALVGQPPYPVEGPLGEILTRIAHADPVNPRSLSGRSRSGFRIDDELATILLKALEKEPQRRYQTAGDLARDIRHHLHGEPLEAKRASGLYMLKKTLRRYRLQTATAGLILLMLFGFMITLAVLLARERDARKRADEKTEEARLAVMSQQEALREARERTAEAMLAQQDLRRALVRQHIQRGNLALARDDLREARDSYWKALEVAPGPAATWALRRYYLQTPDDSAALLRFESHGPSKLSPNGQLAAVCTGPESISVRALGPGTTPGWVRAPGPIALLDVRDDGALAASGPNWAHTWPPGALRPSVALQLPANRSPSAVYAVADGRSLLMVDGRHVRLLGGPLGRGAQHVLLHGRPIGPPEYTAVASDPATSLRAGLPAQVLGQLAVPTSAGVELVTILSNGKLRGELVWTGDATARAVRFDGHELLAVLADALYVATIADAERVLWTRLVDTAPEWDLFDLSRGVGRVVFGTRDGRLGAYRGGELQGAWRCAVDRLEQLRLSIHDRSAITLDDRGTLTHWVGPERLKQRRLIHASPPESWAAAADGSTVLMAVARGRVIAYSPTQASQPRTVLRPRLLGFGAAGISLAVDEGGHRAVIRDRSTLRLVRLADCTSRTLAWNHSTLTVPDKVALSGDGELVALLARSQSGDQQQIALWHWQSPARVASDPSDSLGASLRDQRLAEASEEDLLTTGGPTASPTAAFDFVGAVVRDMAFVPRTQHLLVVRSNGQLLLLDLRRPAAAARAPAASLEPWMTLAAPATTIAFNRTGEYLAAACQDNVVRLISVGRREIRHRLPTSQAVSALAFNPRDDVLLVRTADGTVRLFDPATGESLATWPRPAEADRPLATWIGDEADALLLGHDGGVYEYRYAQADAVIERNRAYAREQQVAHDLTEADFGAAWTAAGDLWELDSARGRWVQVTVLEVALRRANVEVPLKWVDTVLLNAPAATYLRLGHAAYDGGRFELAGQWLRRGCETAGGVVDTFTQWRIAQCDYLAEAYDDAEAGLATVLAEPDFDPTRAPTVALQRVSALVLGGRLTDARRAAVRVGDRDAQGRYGDIVASTYASVIARLITGLERESPAATIVDGLLGTIGERSLLFRDDEHFFAGELARQRGDLVQAVVQYQRCVDLARDEWPANWARHRLTQISSQPQP